MNPLRILMVTNNYTPYTGGVVRSIDTTTAQLQKEGHSVLIVTLDFLGSHPGDPSWVRRIACPIKFIYKKNYMALPWRPNSAIQKLIDDFNPHIVHSHHPALLGNAAAQVALQAKIPLVFTYHTLYDEYAHYMPLPRYFAQTMIRHVVRSYCKKVQGIVVPSLGVHTLLKARGVTTPMQVIASSIDPCFLGPLRMRDVLQGRPLHILWVGRFVPEKNVAQLIDALALVRRQGISFKVTLVGYGAQEELFKRYAYEHYAFSRDAISFVHKPCQAVLAQLYQQADLFIFTSRTDTQALVLAEAMAGGMPVIALPGPGQEAIIQDGHNGFLVPTVEAMAAAVHRYVQDSNLRVRMQHHAWQTAQSYAPAVKVHELVAWYRQFAK